MGSFNPAWIYYYEQERVGKNIKHRTNEGIEVVNFVNVSYRFSENHLGNVYVIHKKLKFPEKLIRENEDFTKAVVPSIHNVREFIIYNSKIFQEFDNAAKF